MGKRKDNEASGEVNSRILLLILDELRAIRKQMDTALGANGERISQPPSIPLRPEAPPLPAKKEVAEVEIVDAEIVDDQKTKPTKPTKPKAPPAPKAKKKSAKPKPPAKPKSTPKPAKTTPKKQAKAQPKTKPAAPKQPQNTETFNLPAPTSPDEEVKLFAAQKQRIENMMSVAQFTRAEKLAQALLAVVPDSDDAEALLDTVRRESSAFRSEQQSRLFAEFQRWTESRQWIKALAVGEQLLEKYAASTEGKKVASSMSTVSKNAHFEEARALRDRIRDLIKRKRYSEAIEIANDLILRFPNTQVAKQLRTLLPDLKRRSVQFR
ncbi:MAG: hypothetical protein QGH60_16125 [Phycisphaerae bacterium]|jgi:outer membrane biosynthesis protein TonB|nr:hypothetical protein [Phycisphaerae bacterium]